MLTKFLRAYLKKNNFQYAVPPEVGEEKCELYNLCRDLATPIPPRQCTNNMVFDRNHGVCVSREKAPCSLPDEETPTVCPCEEEPPSSLCVQDRIVNIRVTGSCTRYLVCLGDLRLGENECRPDYYFNPSIGECDHRINVE